jgi:hypothetical protein
MILLAPSDVLEVAENVVPPVAPLAGVHSLIITVIIEGDYSEKHEDD